MLGYSGGPVLTPHIDRIARKGVSARRFHTVHPTCTPSRFCYLTGTYGGRCKVESFLDENPVDESYNLGFNVKVIDESPNIARLFRDAGYTTAHVGKWHVGRPRRQVIQGGYRPQDDPAKPEVARRLQEDYRSMCDEVRRVGYDYVAGLVWGNTDGRPITALRHHNLEWHTASALDFLTDRAEADDPFFLTVATTTIHGPHHVESLRADPRACEHGYLEEAPKVQPSRESVMDRLAEADDVELHHVSAGALWMDDAVGAVVDRIEQMGLAEDTIFIFSTDHGPGTISGKFTIYQGGMRIPFCMRWDGHIPAGSTCDALLCNVDFLPTLAQAAGVEIPADYRLDGQSRWGQLTGQAQDDRDFLYHSWGYCRAVAGKKWKYAAWRHPHQQIQQMQQGQVDMAFTQFGKAQGHYEMHHYPHYFDPDQLYDLEDDPDEQNNLAALPQYADVLRQMRQKLRGVLETFDHPFDLDRVDPFVTGAKHKQLAQASLADTRPFQAGWYKQHGY
jgi:arylsulfatase A-like enzyme